MYTDKQILELINNYINDSRVKSAIMIDGEWGSGKTHFIEETLIPDLTKKSNADEKEKKEIIYISLYGVNKEKDISEAIILKRFTNSKSDSGSSPVVSITNTLIKGVSNFFNVSDSYEDIINLIPLSNLVIIFDDVERCGLDITCLLGYINNLVEHNNTKCILVCNEKHIGIASFTNNLESKYDVIINSEIGIKDGETKFTRKFLEEKAKEILNSDILYKETKEKLIGTTIKYECIFDDIYEKIIDSNITDKKTKETCLKSKVKVIEKLNEKNCKNLRTFIFSIIKFENVVKFILGTPEIGSNEINDYNILDDILINCVLDSISFKENINTKDKGTYEDLSFYTSLFDSSLNLKFINKYIKYEILDQELMCDELNAIISSEQKKKLNSQLSYYNCKNWTIMNDSEVISFISKSTEEILENKYDINTCFSIIRTLEMYLEFGFKVNLDEIEKHITRNLSNIDTTNYKEIFHRIDIKSEKSDVLINIYHELTNFKEATRITKYNAILDSDDWSNQIYNIINTKETKYSERYLLSFFNEEKFLNTIKTSSNENLYYFYMFLKINYDFSNLGDIYYSQYDLFKKIQFTINKLDCKDKIIMSKLLDFLKKKVDDIVNNLLVYQTD